MFSMKLKEVNIIFRPVFYLPFLLTIVVPSILLFNDVVYFSTIDFWGAVLGSVMLSVGIYIQLITIKVLDHIGEKDSVPWKQPKLVMHGHYKYVRYPMFLGILFMLVGEVILSGSLKILSWVMFLFAVNLAYILAIDEPRLHHKYGKKFHNHKKKVPRIIPKLL